MMLTAVYVCVVPCSRYVFEANQDREPLIPENLHMDSSKPVPENGFEGLHAKQAQSRKARKQDHINLSFHIEMKKASIEYIANKSFGGKPGRSKPRKSLTKCKEQCKGRRRKASNLANLRERAGVEAEGVVGVSMLITPLQLQCQKLLLTKKI